MPAGENFHAVYLPGFPVHQRLIVGNDITLGDGVAQLFLFRGVNIKIFTHQEIKQQRNRENKDQQAGAIIYQAGEIKQKRLGIGNTKRVGGRGKYLLVWVRSQWLNIAISGNHLVLHPECQPVVIGIAI